MAQNFEQIAFTRSKKDESSAGAPSDSSYASNIMSQVNTSHSISSNNWSKGNIECS